jgi:hypothetical protein
VSGTLFGVAVSRHYGDGCYSASWQWIGLLGVPLVER